jgi:hypothetical protein
MVLFGPVGSRVSFAAGKPKVEGAERNLGDVLLERGARVDGNRLRLRGRFDGVFFVGIYSNNWESREEVTAGVRVKLTDQLAIGGQTRRDWSTRHTTRPRPRAQRHRTRRSSGRHKPRNRPPAR